MGIKRKSSELKYNDLVFIFGAGAHQPYGFPTASGLTEKLRDLWLNGGNHGLSDPVLALFAKETIQYDKIMICRAMLGLKIVERPKGNSDINGDEVEVNKVLQLFLSSFFNSSVDSIDRYLHSCAINSPMDKMSQEIGRLLISYFLRKAEITNFVGSTRPDWIQFVINRYLINSNSLDLFLREPPTIFTFNYDTFLERSIFLHLIHYWKWDEERAKEAVKKLNIVHLYGSLCDFDSKDSYNDLNFLRASMKAIKIIGPERDAAEIKPAQYMRSKITGIRKIYLLGFGFDRLNTGVLFDSDLQEDLLDRKIEIFSTNIGIDRYKAIDVKNFCELNIQFFLSNKLDENVDILKLLSKMEPIEKVLSKSVTVQL